MTHDQIHLRLTTLADQLQEQHTVIASSHPKDEEGFTQPANADLADALRAMDDAIRILTRLAYKMERERE